METGRSLLTELNRDQCFRHLERVRLARVGVSIDALPAIFPVFMTLVDDVAVFRTVPGTKLDAASRGAIVALEIGEFDASSGEGWSVLIRGVARELQDGPGAELARRRLGTSWIDGAPEHLVEVSTDLVTGRRIG